MHELPLTSALLHWHVLVCLRQVAETNGVNICLPVAHPTYLRSTYAQVHQAGQSLLLAVHPGSVHHIHPGHCPLFHDEPSHQVTMNPALG